MQVESILCAHDKIRSEFYHNFYSVLWNEILSIRCIFNYSKYYIRDRGARERERKRLEDGEQDNKEYFLRIQNMNDIQSFISYDVKLKIPLNECGVQR